MATTKLWKLNPELEPEFSLQQDALVNLMREFYAEEGYGFDAKSQRERILEFVANPAYGALFLIVFDGQIAGYAVLAYGFSFEYGGKDAFIDELFVSEPFRNRGLGSEALIEISDFARSQAVKVLHLETEAENSRAKALYLRHGFVDRSRSLLSKRP